MANIQFQDHRLADFTAPLTVENAMRTYFNFGQIHIHLFEKIYEQGSAFWIATGNPGTGLTGHSEDETEIFINATSSTGTWHKLINLTEVPHSILLKYRKESDPQSAIVGVQNDGSYYTVATRSGHVTFLKTNETGTTETILDIVKSYPTGIADVQVALRHIRFSDNDNDLWRCISLWMNNAMICTYVEKVDTLLTNPIYFGLGTYAGNSSTYSNVSIPQLTEFAETCTLDPSENPMGGLQRAIEGRYIKMTMRHNGGIRAWRPKESPSRHSFGYGVILSKDLPFDRRSIFNHVRMVGAYRQAEFVRPDLIKQQGHRFVEMNNPFIMTEAECLDQARLSILRMESEANAQQLVTPFTPLLQMEDRITTPDGDYIITQREIQIDQSKIYQNLQTRKYNLVGA